MAEPTGILAGVRIVDLTQGLAGPVATRLLAEAGAEVIKVEPPAGDPMRGLAAFASWNRSKKSVVLDLRDPIDRANLDRLLAEADVFVHGLRPSKARALALDDDSLAERFPSLIAAAVLGYPVDHPDAERPGIDLLVQARAGLLDEQPGVRPSPTFLRFPLPSWTAVHLVAAGILARLILRGRTGRAGPAHTSLHQGAMAVMAMLWSRAEHPTPTIVQRANYLGGGCPVFECADGEWLQLVGVVEIPAMTEALREIGLADVGMPGTRERMDAIREAFRNRKSTEWLEAYATADVAATRVHRLGEVFYDEHAHLCGYVVEIDDPVWGPTLQAASPYEIDPPARVVSPAPALGADTEAVLGSLGTDLVRPVTPGEPHSGAHPLAGVKVLDLGMCLAGPFAPMCLADLGADVVKLEPTSGDQMRGSEQLFAGCQRGKRSIALDLRRPEARPVLERLVRWADVVHHNIRMPAARRLGIDPEALHAINPGVVVCHTGTYGFRGPKANLPGYDPTGQALSGWEPENGGEGNPPLWFRFGMMDHQCALTSLVGTLLALYHRDRSGRGTKVTASLLGGAILTSSETLVRLGDHRAVPVAGLDHEQTGTGPGYRIYETLDRWVAVAALTPEAREMLRRVTGVSSDAELPAAFRECLADAVQTELSDAGVPAEVVRVDQREPFFDSEANRRARLSVSYPHPVYGRFEQPGAFWNFGDLALKLDLAPPVPGQHSLEILKQLGYGDSEISDLSEAGVVAGPEADVGMVPLGLVGNARVETT